MDFGARFYDSRISRWTAVDPLVGKYSGLSPYSFVANSPLISIDPNGEEIIWKVNMFQKILIKRELKKYSSSDIFRKMMEELENSHKIYTIEAIKDSKALGRFKGNYGSESKIRAVFMENEETGEYEEFISASTVRSPTKKGLGGSILFNKNKLFGFASGKYNSVEEFVHAWQYDTYVDDLNNAYESNVPGILNQEFEAKVVSKLIGNESEVNIQPGYLEGEPFEFANFITEGRVNELNDSYKSHFKIWQYSVDQAPSIFGRGYNGVKPTDDGAVTDSKPEVLEKALK